MIFPRGHGRTLDDLGAVDKKAVYTHPRIHRRKMFVSYITQGCMLMVGTGTQRFAILVYWRALGGAFDDSIMNISISSSIDLAQTYPRAYGTHEPERRVQCIMSGSTRVCVHTQPTMSQSKLGADQSKRKPLYVAAGKADGRTWQATGSRKRGGSAHRSFTKAVGEHGWQGEPRFLLGLRYPAEMRDGPLYCSACLRFSSVGGACEAGGE